MKKIIALIALILAACAVSMPVSAVETWTNHYRIPGTIMTGNVSVDTSIITLKPLEATPYKYPTKIIWNKLADKVISYDGKTATQNVVMTENSVAYDGNSEQMVFDDGQKERAGFIEIMWFDKGVPEKNIMNRVLIAAIEEIGGKILEIHENSTFAEYPATTWEIINPLTDKEGKMVQILLSDNAVYNAFADVSSYRNMNVNTTFGGLL